MKIMKQIDLKWFEGEGGGLWLEGLRFGEGLFVEKANKKSVNNSS